MLKCQVCDKFYSKTKTLKQHMASVHLGGKTNNCGSCDRSFVRRADLVRHEESVHNKRPGQIECENCRKTFTRRDNMLKHMKHCIVNDDQ